MSEALKISIYIINYGNSTRYKKFRLYGPNVFLSYPHVALCVSLCELGR